jgi:lipopolysaccharide/colanic/teichoic acid biosynthesis glycosyltransferase
MHECTEVDLEYIAEISFSSDISILLRTPAAMFHRRGY